MFISASLKRSSLWLLAFLPLVGLSADYAYSDKYGFSFYVPATYKKVQVSNDYGPFLQYTHPEAKLFVHFWARSRPSNSDMAFLKRAYENDFMQPFITRKLAKEKLRKVENRAFLFSYSVEILERPYEAEIYYIVEKRRFYIMGFYFPKGAKGKIKKDLELVLYSLLYGR